MSRGQEFAGIFRGAQIVAEALVKEQSTYAREIWANSSVRELLENRLGNLGQCKDKIIRDPGKEFQSVGSIFKEAFERSSVMTQGLRQYVKPISDSTAQKSNDSKGDYSSSNSPGDQKINLNELDVSQVTLNELEGILSDIKQKKVRLSYDDKKKKPAPMEKEKLTSQIAFETAKMQSQVKADPLSSDVDKVKSILNVVATYGQDEAGKNAPEEVIKQQELSVVAKQRKVPSSRFGRVLSFGNLFAGLGFGTITELTKGALGIGGTTNVKEAVLSPDNTERIVDTLCKVRGAALKLGQILSIQDSNVVSPQLAKAFDRVRQAADYMPDWQVENVLVAEFGDDWREKLKSFEDKPFAAASIGQVHRAEMLDGTLVALKIQYPGVAKSIESDIDNLVSMLKLWNIFPPGMFIDNVVKVAKRELAWEVDYNREAEYTERFAELIAGNREFRVPKVIKSLSTANILATEFAPGLPVDQCSHLSYDHKTHIARSVMKLCLLELFEYRCMQTDPNWANFLYDPSTRIITLIDFGATRFYPKKFMDDYLKIIVAASKKDRKTVHDYSVKMGFLTGYESQTMANAHIDAVMILGEVFSIPGDFDFGHQDTTKRIADLVPVMVAHRLCPPPDEIYSLHRKLSGVFLLCSKLQVKINCKPQFDEIVRNYKFDHIS